jgi:hypothetical protein
MRGYNMRIKEKKVKVVSCKLSRSEHKKFIAWKNKNNLKTNTIALRQLIEVAIKD